ncbi:MAG: S9 family peptidase, partial [Candidatus Aminicenantes bacterium]|nr:S9 family peptidase [Candidatus Aminicenantes bacterium]
MGKTLKKFLIIFCAVAFVTNFSGFAQNQKNGFTSEDYFNFEWVSDPQVSPGGKTIIYVRNFVDIMTDMFYSNLWTINFDGTGNRPLTSGLYHDASPRWSPDGRTIIYVSDREGKKAQIFKRWMDTGQTVVLTNLLFGPTGISWSPDGKWIAFSAPVPTMPRTITQMPAAPPGANWAPSPKIVDKAIYRFDGMGYQVSMGYMHLFVMPSDGGTPRQLSQGNFHHPFPMFGGSLEWAPDSKSIVLSANRQDDWELDMTNSEIYNFSVADGKMTELTKRKGPDNSPVISPDGKYIAYTGFDDRYLGYQVTMLYVMNRDGSDSRAVTADLDRSVGQIQWVKDGKGLYITFADKGNTKLAHVALDGKITKLADNLGDGRIAYGGGSYSVASNGDFVYTFTRPDHASDLAVASVTNPKVKIITSVNEDIFGHKKLAEVEEIWYESSKDSRKIHGWIMKPPDFDPSEKYPLILEIHGGPFANYGSRFSIEKQLLAGAGYVVLFTNPRGSTSYGEKFGNLIHHAYPGDDFYDLNSGVD